MSGNCTGARRKILSRLLTRNHFWFICISVIPILLREIAQKVIICGSRMLPVWTAVTKHGGAARTQSSGNIDFQSGKRIFCDPHKLAADGYHKIGNFLSNFGSVCGSVISILLRKNVQKSIICGSNTLAADGCHKTGAGHFLIIFEHICESMVSILIRKNVQKSIIFDSNMDRCHKIGDSFWNHLRIGNIDSHSGKRSEIDYLWLQ